MGLKDLSFRYTLINLLLAGIVTASVLLLPLDFLEAPLFDLRQKFSIKPEADPSIVLITIDDITGAELNDILPLNLEHHAELIEKLELANPKAVEYIADFNQVQVLNDNPKPKEYINRIVRAGVRMNVTGIPFVVGIPFDLNGEVVPPPAVQVLPYSVAMIHRDGKIFGKDRVTRRALVSLFDRATAEASIASRTFTDQDFSHPPGIYRLHEPDADYFFFRQHQKNGLVYDSSYDRFPYARYSALDVIQGRVGEKELAGKIIIVGDHQRENPNDQTIIPHGLDPLPVPKILVHAFILDSLLHHEGILHMPLWMIGILIFMNSLVLISASFQMRPSRLLWAALASLSGWLIFAWAAFQPSNFFPGVWVPIASSVASILMSFYIMLPVRLYYEHRKRGQLEEQNRALRELEEMKTNFLQLVTHDLKTPIAKVQGLAERLERTLRPALGSQEQTLIHHIVDAGDELNHFVTSLLELGRIDTQGLRVNLQSKDINHILEATIEKLRYAAQAKQITILTEFEPLFPIRVDSNLISKVLSNLLDNALKYSPENTSVRVETREEGDNVMVTIRDQGPGIPETEQKYLFQRFHRGKSEINKTIKGTGLGLYLAKYFIEAHRGSIEVQSEIGVGTTFVVRLPSHLKDQDVLPGLKTEIDKTNKETKYA